MIDMADFTTAEIYMMVDGKIVSRIGKRRICLIPGDPHRGTMVKDGRVVHKITNFQNPIDITEKEPWVYFSE